MARQYTTCSSSSCSNNITISNEDFVIKQGDTCPTFKIQIKNPETGEPVSFRDWTVSTYMYFTSCLKSNTDDSTSYNSSVIKLLGNANLCQVKIGDIIGVDDCNQNRNEFMLVLDIDYDTGEIIVSRGYGDSDIYTHKKGDKLIFYRIYGAVGYINSEFENIDDNSNESETEPDTGLGDSSEDEGDYSIIGYNWTAEDTSHTGTYYFEFKVTNNLIPPQVRSFPVTSNDYVIKII